MFKLKRDDQCGSTRWKAAKAVSRTMPSLDETGLEVGGCRHAIAQKAVNMFHGEMYVYLCCNTFFIIVTVTAMDMHIICTQRYLLHEMLAISGRTSSVNIGLGHVTRSTFFQEAWT